MMLSELRMVNQLRSGANAPDAGCEQAASPHTMALALEVVERFRIARATGLKPTDLEIDPAQYAEFAQAVIDMHAALDELWDFFEGGDPSEGVVEGDWAAMVKDIEHQYHERSKHVGTWAREVCRLRKQLESERAKRA